MPPDTVAEASTTTNTKPPDALPRVTVVTRELIAIPTTGVIPERRAKPVISGTELLAIGTSGRETTVEAAPRAIREAVYTARTDAVGAAVSQDQPADHARENAEETSEREASLKLSPISASRQPLANVPRSFTAPATERVIHAAPIVEPDRALVDRVLQQYAEAFGRLDAEATKAVYPSVDYVALRRAFNQLETQRLTFESCGITISGSGRDANARCQGEASYRPRIGPRTLHRDSREWTFDLAKADAGWQIVKATVR